MPLHESERATPPDCYFDLTAGQVIIGEEAYEAHLLSGGHPADIFKLSDLLNNGFPDSVSFANQDKRPDRWEDVTAEEVAEKGRWLMDVSSNGDHVKTFQTVKIDRSSRLDLLIGRKAIESPTKFGGIPEFQVAIGAERIRWREAFDHWDNIDIWIHLHNIGEEEGQRPTIPIIDRRNGEGRREPRAYFIRSRMRLQDAYEMAGFTYTREWDKPRHEEWGVLFYLANGRTPTENMLDDLAAQGRGPSSHGIYKEYEALPTYQEAVVNAVDNRSRIKLAAMKNQVSKGALPKSLFNEPSNLNEAIRRVSRYKIIDLLLPDQSVIDKVRLSLYDVKGSDFTDYLKRWDERIEQWLVEAAARSQMCYPELFPDGDYIKSLKINA